LIDQQVQIGSYSNRSWPYKYRNRYKNLIAKKAVHQIKDPMIYAKQEHNSIEKDSTHEHKKAKTHSCR